MSSLDREGVGRTLQAKGQHGENSERVQECQMKQSIGEDRI